MDPVTGFFRTGLCDTDGRDVGQHTACVEMTEEFLVFARELGNDLITPMPQYEFPGLKPGDRWCVCVDTVAEAVEAQVPVKLVLNATHASVLEFITRDQLKACAADF